MVSERIVIEAPQGVHLRPAGSLCEAAIKFKSAISIEMSSGRNANAKSVLSVLAAGIKCGDEVLLKCDGEDEEEALKTIKGILLEALNN